MAQVSSDNSTKHKHNKPVAVAQDREVLSFSIRNSNNSKRKIGERLMMLNQILFPLPHLSEYYIIGVK
jgi:hypothetical protein